MLKIEVEQDDGRWIGDVHWEVVRFGRLSSFGGYLGAGPSIYPALRYSSRHLWYSLMAMAPRIKPNPAPLQTLVYFPSGLWNVLVSLMQPARHRVRSQIP